MNRRNRTNRELADNETARVIEYRQADGYEDTIGDGWDYVEHRTRLARRFLRNLELRKHREATR